MAVKQRAEGLGQSEREREDFLDRTAGASDGRATGSSAVPEIHPPARLERAVSAIGYAKLAEPPPGFLPPMPPTPIYDLSMAADQVKEGAWEGCKAGDAVGITVHSTDPNGGKIAYRILSDSSKGGFAIDGKSGVMTVKDPARLDYENATNHQHKITVEARDWDGLFTVKTFTVTLLDVAESPGTVIDLGTLPATAGFRVDGGYAGQASGHPVAGAGDVNGDGFDDFLVDAGFATSPGSEWPGSSYVVFGKGSGLANLDLGALPPAAGFYIDGTQVAEWSGWSSAAAGDVNGDGFGDVIVGAYGFDLFDGDLTGSSYVLFGKSEGFADVDLADPLPAAAGFRIDGSGSQDHAGFSVATAGDVNGDGFDDLLIGARGPSSLNPGFGSAYVVFGKSGSFGEIDLANLSTAAGFRIKGAAKGDWNGFSVATAGDVNGDGFADLVIGSPRAAPGGKESAGASVVIFGKSKGFADIDLADPPDDAGFRIAGATAHDSTGWSVAGIGDLNGDGFDDIIVGSREADPNGRTNAGSTTVIFGHGGAFADLDLATPASGLRIIGATTGDSSGTSVASAGDVNGDGFDDLIIGAWLAKPSGKLEAGSSYVVFGGGAGMLGDIDLNFLPASAGFRIDGAMAGDHSGRSVASAGDVNGDGFDDLILGADGADPNGKGSAGSSYVVFGGDFSGKVTQQGSSAADSLTGTSAADAMIGGLGDDVIFGKGGKDVIKGGAGDDVLHVGDATFFRADGGGGADSLVFDYAGAVDLKNIDGLDATSDRGRIQGIEVLDFANGKANTVTLRLADLLDMDVGDRDIGGVAGLDNVLRIEGEAGDVLKMSLVDGWNGPDNATLPGYTLYAHGAIELAVNSAVAVSFYFGP